MLIDSAAITRLTLLKAIRKSAPISRVQLAKMLQLSKGAVSAVTAELISSGLIGEEGNAAQERGRPRVLLRIQADNFAVVGASLDPLGFLELCLVDLTGKLIAKDNIPLAQLASVEGLARWIGEVLDNFIGRAPVDRARIVSAAIALPGVIESSTGLLKWFPSVPGEDVPAAAIIADRLDLPVIIENDLDCLARAEHWFGDGADAADFTIVYQGLSVGLTQYADGLPRTGIAGVNAEFGHVKTDYGDHARRCFCGARGCLTSYSSDLGLFVSRSSGAGGAAPDIADVVAGTPAIIEAAVAGEPDAIAAIAIAGRHLGLALADYLNIFDPGLVLIKTADPRMPDLIRAELEAAISENALPALVQRTRIEIDAVQSDWRWKGTAALALEQAYLGKAVNHSRLASGNVPAANLKLATGRN